MRLLRPGSLQQSLRNLVIPRQPVRIIDSNQKSSPYILTFTSPSSSKRDSQLVFPMPAIGNSANNDFVTNRGQIQSCYYGLKLPFKLCQFNLAAFIMM